jgi:hypothetical protein
MYESKFTKRLWIAISILGIIAMLFFTIMPAFQGGF